MYAIGSIDLCSIGIMLCCVLMNAEAEKWIDIWMLRWNALRVGCYKDYCAVKLVNRLLDQVGDVEDCWFLCACGLSNRKCSPGEDEDVTVRNGIEIMVPR